VGGWGVGGGRGWGGRFGGGMGVGGCCVRGWGGGGGCPDTHALTLLSKADGWQLSERESREASPQHPRDTESKQRLLQ